MNIVNLHPPRTITPSVELDSPLFLLTRALQLLEGLATQITYQSRTTPEMALGARLASCADGPGLFQLELVWDETEYSPDTQCREIVFVIDNQIDALQMDCRLTFRTSGRAEQPKLETETVSLVFGGRSARAEVTRALAAGFLRFINSGETRLATHLRDDLMGICAAFKNLHD